MTRLALVALLAASVGCRSAGTQSMNAGDAAARTATADPRDGRELIQQMRRDGRTYRTLTFVQTTTFPDRPAETWWESAQMPGTLRIDMAPLDSQRVSIYRNDSLYVSRIGRPWRSRPYVHSLLVLLGDVFVLPAEASIAKLTTLGFDLSKIREDRYDERKVWVVGAERGDSTTPQFWIDAERLYMVRIIERTPGQQPGTFEGRVTRHQRFGDIWVETEMTFFMNGREIQREVYNDVQVNPQLDPSIFVPGAAYVRPSWIRP